MKVVITSATEKETEQIKSSIRDFYTNENTQLGVTFHVSGVGILASCFSIAKLIFEQKPDLIIQAGIAGSFNSSLSPGEVVAVKHELLADTGVEEENRFKDLFDLNLLSENSFPFTERKLTNKHLSDLNFLQLEEVTSMTINEITTRKARIEELKIKYGAQIESMEGASLHYCCLQTSTPFIQIRAISNYIGERNKSKWNFKESLANLNDSVLKYVNHLPIDNTTINRIR